MPLSKALCWLLPNRETERNLNLYLQLASEVDGKKKLKKKKNQSRTKIKDLSTFCNKTWLKQHRKASSLNSLRFPNSNNPVRDAWNIKANQVSRALFKYKCFS